MYVYEATIEVTRNCNMWCEHCMRGDPQKRVMKKEYVYQFLSKISDIGTLNIGGGEPSLVPHKIDEIVDVALYTKTDIQNFYIVTNGKRLTKPFFDAVERLYKYCSENEISSLAISKDRFHERVDYSYATEDYLEYFEEVGILSEKEVYTVIGEGRGWGVPPHEEEYEIGDYGVEGKENDITTGNLYLNAKGNIIAGCDWSYESQDLPHNIICKVEDFSIDKVKEYMSKKKAMQQVQTVEVYV
jgi:hypothetical protein